MKKNKYTVVTGASSGIGYSVSKAFSKRGKNLIIVARREERLIALKNDIKKEHPNLEVIIKVKDLQATKNVHELYDELREYDIETWVNNAGFGINSLVQNQTIEETERMILLNIQALTTLSMYFVRDYKDKEGATLINISSTYGIIPTAVVYSATKTYVSAFTEGLAQELEEEHAKMRIKLLAPAKTKTEFAGIANDVKDFDYDNGGGSYYTSDEVAKLLLELYDSNSILGHVNRDDFTFHLSDPKFTYYSTKK